MPFNDACEDCWLTAVVLRIGWVEVKSRKTTEPGWTAKFANLVKIRIGMTVRDFTPVSVDSVVASGYRFEVRGEAFFDDEIKAMSGGFVTAEDLARRIPGIERFQDLKGPDGKLVSGVRLRDNSRPRILVTYVEGQTSAISHILESKNHLEENQHQEVMSKQGRTNMPGLSTTDELLRNFVEALSSTPSTSSCSVENLRGHIQTLRTSGGGGLVVPGSGAGEGEATAVADAAVPQGDECDEMLFKELFDDADQAHSVMAAGSTELAAGPGPAGAIEVAGGRLAAEAAAAEAGLQEHSGKPPKKRKQAPPTSTPPHPKKKANKKGGSAAAANPLNIITMPTGGEDSISPAAAVLSPAGGLGSSSDDPGMNSEDPPELSSVKQRVNIDRILEGAKLGREISGAVVLQR